MFMCKMFALLCIFALILQISEQHYHSRIDLYRHKSARHILLDHPEFAEKLRIPRELLMHRKPKPPPKPKTNDTIPLFRLLDSEFYGMVNIGSPGQKFKMVFDTTWSDSYVISALCPDSIVGCAGHAKYNHDHSSTYVENGTKVNYDEGIYNISGFYSFDKFVVGQTAASKQQFVEVTELKYNDVFSKADGLIGLGFKVKDFVPLFYNIFKESTIKNSIFAVYINRKNPSNKGKGGSILIGGYDEKHIRHVSKNELYNITYVPVDPSKGYWQFQMDRVILDKGKNYTVFCEKGCLALPDSTTTVINVPSSVIDTINLKINARNSQYYPDRYEVDCTQVNRLPFFDFEIAGKNFTLKGPDYTTQYERNGSYICLSCFVADVASTETNYWILGASFLSRYYSIYDIKNKRIGLVESV